MQAKAQGWLKTILGWGQRRQAEVGEKLYGEAVRVARLPVYYSDHGVADDVDGRFDMLSLIVALIMRRLKTAGDDGKELSQQLFDSMFADMDLSLREMGAGDIGVSKRVRVMAEAFMGRLESYVEALDKKDKELLAEALSRNLFRGDPSADPLGSGLVDAMFAVVAALDALDDSALLDGRIDIG